MRLRSADTNCACHCLLILDRCHSLDMLQILPKGCTNIRQTLQQKITFRWRQGNTRNYRIIIFLAIDSDRDVIARLSNLDSAIFNADCGTIDSLVSPQLIPPLKYVCNATKKSLASSPRMIKTPTSVCMCSRGSSLSCCQHV